MKIRSGLFLSLLIAGCARDSGQVMAGAESAPPLAQGTFVVSSAEMSLGEHLDEFLSYKLVGGKGLLLLTVTTDLEDPMRATLRLDHGRDADDPFFPANNFSPLPGRDGCCEFARRSELGVVALREVAGIWVTSTTTNIPGPLLSFEDEGGDRSSFYPVVGPLSSVDARVEQGEEGELLAWIGGDFSAQSLYTDGIAHSGLDLMRALGIQPHHDVDDDGLELVVDTNGDGRIDRCIDGDGTTIHAVDPEVPGSCVLSSEFADGFRVAITLRAVPAKLID